MDMPDKIAVLTAQLAMANDDKARLQAENERLRAFVEWIVSGKLKSNGVRTYNLDEILDEATLLLASLPPGGAGAGDDIPDHR